MKAKSIAMLLLLGIVLLINQTNAVMTRKMLQTTTQAQSSTQQTFVNQKQPLKLNITTQCNKVDLTAEYNYSGIVRSGYLSVGYGGSALAFIFYGKSDVKDISQLKNIPTIIWLNGGPGISSQIGNLRQIGPFVLQRKLNLEIVRNQHSWANKYNLLFVDQPVGTGLSYSDPQSTRPHPTSLEDVTNDFYYALNQLYNTMDGCFNSRNLDIPATAPLFIFGQGYAGKYAPAIAQKIIQEKQRNNGFLKGLKGVGIANGLTSPYLILSELGNFAFHLSLLDYQQRMKVETILLRASKHHVRQNFSNLHDDFHEALNYIVQQSGNVNVHDLRIDGQYEQIIEPYFRDPHNIKLYGLNSGVVFHSHSHDVYDNLKNEFMKSEASRVEYLLSKDIPVLIYQGQNNLLVQTPGTMKWVDKLRFSHSEKFKKQLFKGWKINNKMVGSIKSAGNLEFRIVNNAGHWVSMDNPEASLVMVNSFVQRNK